MIVVFQTMFCMGIYLNISCFDTKFTELGPGGPNDNKAVLVKPLPESMLAKFHDAIWPH